MWFVYALLIMVLIQLRIGTERTTLFKSMHLLIAFLLLLIQPLLVKVLDCISFENLVVSDFMRMYVFFLIGVYGYNVFMVILNGKYRMHIFIFSGVLLCGGNVIRYNGIDYMPMGLLIALSGCLFFMILSIYIGTCYVLGYIGRNSLSIYVLHGLSIAVIRQSMTAMFGHSLNEWIALGTCTLLGILIPLTIYWISTKTWKCDFVFIPTKYINIK